MVKRLADALAVRRNRSYGRVMSWIRCCLAFSLLNFLLTLFVHN